MAKYRIAWMPGDGVGNDVMEATRLVLDRLNSMPNMSLATSGGNFGARKETRCPTEQSKC